VAFIDMNCSDIKLKIVAVDSYKKDFGSNIGRYTGYFD
jgi:hypothetical protein